MSQPEGSGLTPDEARDIARLAGRTAGGIEGLVEGTHDAVLNQVYGAVGAAIGYEKVRPVRVAHEVIAKNAFFWVRTGLKTAGWAAGAAAHATARGTDSGLGGLRAQLALGAVNGLSGDRLVAEGSGLATTMTLRVDDREVPVTTEGLTAAYGTGHERVIVFLHGLVETEHAWRYRSQPRWGEPGVSYAGKLVDETDWLPLLVRYNTGQPIRENGDTLATILSDLVRAWPGPLREIALVGHSMGGLVALTAVSHGDPEWTGLVRAIITLGSPRDGAPLERAAAVAELASEKIAPWRWFGGVLASRSRGIRDLHSRLEHPPLPEGVEDYVLLGSLTPQSWGPDAMQIGDGLVPVPKTRSDETVVLPGLHHLDLLNHPLVYAQLRAWLDGLPAPSEAQAVPSEDPPRE